MVLGEECLEPGLVEGQGCHPEGPVGPVPVLCVQGVEQFQGRGLKDAPRISVVQAALCFPADARVRVTGENLVEVRHVRVVAQLHGVVSLVFAPVECVGWEEAGMPCSSGVMSPVSRRGFRL